MDEIERVLNEIFKLAVRADMNARAVVGAEDDPTTEQVNLPSLTDDIVIAVENAQRGLRRARSSAYIAQMEREDAFGPLADEG